MIDENGPIIPIVREEIVAHFKMLLKALNEYFTVKELKILEEWIMNQYSHSLNDVRNDEV